MSYTKPFLGKLIVDPFIYQTQTGNTPPPDDGGESLTADCNSNVGLGCNSSPLTVNCQETNSMVFFSVFMEGSQLTAQQIASVCDFTGISLATSPPCNSIEAPSSCTQGSDNGYRYVVECHLGGTCPPSGSTINFSCPGYETTETCSYVSDT